MRAEPRFRLRDRDITAPEPEASPEDYAPKPPPPEPRESDVAGDLAAQIIIDCEKILHDLDAVKTANDKMHEQVDTEILNLKTDVQQRVTILQNGLLKKKEWGTKTIGGLRELFTETKPTNAN